MRELDQPNTATDVSLAQAATADAGLRCPRCEYNLTGLPEPRCPECGLAFDWAEVRRLAKQRPRILFERARGWWKIPACLVTWATVLFAPWIFARQIVARVSGRHALVFGGLCFASTFLALISGADHAFMVAWLTAAFVCVLAQALLLTLLDASGWRQPLRSVWFWLLVAGYTSAVMSTEVVYGPPLLGLSDLDDLLRAILTVFRWPTGAGNPEAYVYLLQIGLWSLGLGCIYFARVRRRGWPIVLILLPSIVAALAVIVLYAAIVEHVGLPIHDWLDPTWY